MKPVKFIKSQSRDGFDAFAAGVEIGYLTKTVSGVWYAEAFVARRDGRFVRTLRNAKAALIEMAA